MTRIDGRGFRIVDDLYYIGGWNVSTHLITSEEGHILIDTGWPGDGPSLLWRMSDLGFDPKDLKYILITHAHLDHLGSTKLLVEETGAKVCIGQGDLRAAEQGTGRTYGSETETGVSGRLFDVDMPLREGDVITVGDNEIRVYDTPGHTPGVCSFGFDVVEGDRSYKAFLFGGPGNLFPAVREGRDPYRGTVQQFSETLDRLETFEVDVFLGPHPFVNGTFEKRVLLEQGIQPNPFIDPDGWKDHIKGLKESIQAFL